MDKTIKTKLLQSIKESVRDRFDNMTIQEWETIQKEIKKLPEITTDWQSVEKHMRLLGIDINRLFMNEYYNQVWQQQLNETK